MRDPKRLYRRWVRCYISDAKYYMHQSKIQDDYVYTYWHQQSHIQYRDRYKKYVIEKIEATISYLKKLS